MLAQASINLYRYLSPWRIVSVPCRGGFGGIARLCRFLALCRAALSGFSLRFAVVATGPIGGFAPAGLWLLRLLALFGWRGWNHVVRFKAINLLALEFALDQLFNIQQLFGFIRTDQ